VEIYKFFVFSFCQPRPSNDESLGSRWCVVCVSNEGTSGSHISFYCLQLLTKLVPLGVVTLESLRSDSGGSLRSIHLVNMYSKELSSERD